MIVWHILSLIHKDASRRLVISSITNRKIDDRFTSITNINISPSVRTLTKLSAKLAIHLWHSHLDIWFDFSIWERERGHASHASCKTVCRKTCFWHLSADNRCVDTHCSFAAHSRWSFVKCTASINTFVIYSRRESVIVSTAPMSETNTDAAGLQMEKEKENRETHQLQLREHDDTLMAFNDLRWLNCIRYSAINNKIIL